jgi:hypothetical protein
MTCALCHKDLTDIPHVAEASTDKYALLTSDVMSELVYIDPTIINHYCYRCKALMIIDPKDMPSA